MSTDDKQLRILFNLTKQTKSGALRWTLMKPPAALTKRRIIVPFFAARWQQKSGQYLWLAIFLPQGIQSSFARLFPPPRAELSIFSPNWKLLYTFPPTPAIDALYGDVVLNARRVDELLDSLLEEGGQPAPPDSIEHRQGIETPEEEDDNEPEVR